MESYVKDLKNQVQCLLCNETMYEPKLLQCFHTFCKPCIKSNTQLHGQVNVFKCPQCTSQTVLEQLEDVEDLQTSPIHSRILKVLSFLENQKVCSVEVSHCEALWRCLDCDCSLCDECLGYHTRFSKNHKVISLSNMRKEDIETMIKREEPCKIHTSQDVELYCRHCDALICLLCLKDHAHDKDDLSSMETLQDFITNETKCIFKNLEEIEKLTTSDEERKQQEEIAIDIRDYGKKAKENVKKVTKHLVKTLINHEQQLLTEIQKATTKAERNLRILHHTSAAQEYVKYFAENATASEIMEIRDEKCSQKFNYQPFQKELGGIHFKPNEELNNQVKTGLGRVTSIKKADAMSCSIKVEPNIEAKKTSKLTVIMKSSEGIVADGESVDKVTIQVTPEDDVQIGEKRMEVSGEVIVDFIACVLGQVTVHANVRGNPVSNSPVVMNIEPQNIPIKDSKIIKRLNIGSNSYNGIAVNSTNDRIAVADRTSHCIRVFNMEGELLLKFGSEGNGQEQYKYPGGLAFLGETDLVITDQSNNRICILDTLKGRTKKTIRCIGNGNKHLMIPTGVCIDDDSNIFVCDIDNNCIQVFSADGAHLYHFSLPNGKPFDITIHKGLFYVTNITSAVVHVVEMKDKQLSSIIRSIGGKVVQLKEPRGLAIDSDNNLLVCNTFDEQIYKFTLDGRYIGKTNNQLTGFRSYVAALADGTAIYSTYDGGLFAI